MTAVVAAAGCASLPAGGGAGGRLLKSPLDSHPDGTPEGASADGTRNPVLLACGYGPGRDSRNPKIAPRGTRTPSGASRRSIPPAGTRKSGDTAARPAPQNPTAGRR